MVTPRTARYLLLGIVAACISVTATLMAFDASRPVAVRPAVTRPSQFQIPDYLPGNLTVISIGPAHPGAPDNGVNLVPHDIVVTPAGLPAG